MVAAKCCFGVVGPTHASVPSAAPAPPNGTRGAAPPRLPDSTRASDKRAPGPQSRTAGSGRIRDPPVRLLLPRWPAGYDDERSDPPSGELEGQPARRGRETEPRAGGGDEAARPTEIVAVRGAADRESIRFRRGHAGGARGGMP